MNNNDNNPEFYMTIALEEAKKAHDEGEIPVGAAIVFKDGVIATAHNTTRQCSDPTAHAELIAIKQAAMVL
ncbi:MAG TPA: deaminase, partial [Spirochaetota bacterium]|nr:deaminase [Spirochaetota bacterium]